MFYVCYDIVYIVMICFMLWYVEIQEPVLGAFMCFTWEMFDTEQFGGKCF